MVASIPRWSAISRIQDPAARVWLVAMGGWAGRAIQVVSQLFAIRILTQALGVEGYSIFAILASLAGWFALADFSLAISAQNFVSERRVAKTSTDDVILTAALLALGSSVVAGIVVFLVGPAIASHLLSEFGSFTEAQKTIAFWAVAYPAIGTALGGVAYRILFAQHHGYLSNLLPAVGTFAGTVGVWLVATRGASFTLGWITLVYYLPLTLVAMAALCVIVRGAWRCRGRLSAELVGPMLHRAFKFWVFGILAAGVLQVDYIIMSQTLSSEDIVTYNVASKVFALILFVYSALLHALWPVCSEAIARGDWEATFANVRKYLAIGFAFVLVCGLAFGLAQGLIVDFLSPTIPVSIPWIVVVLLTVYTAFRVWTDTFGMVLQSMNDLTIFWLAVPFQALLSIGLQIAGARLFGLPGMVAGLMLCFALTTAWILPLRCVRNARRAAVA
jgi:O-antigen/teichoic acid export membrane protein